ncbi:MAG: arsenite methyltransferase [Calditrichaeota bacterium]|nr:arsenite methyltransferase [Calditrichota bacterium]MCB9369483.1 arsenite methyltransferase [Calditrichota bacterium]
MENLLNIREVVREKYGQAARGESCCGTSGCCGASNVEDIAEAIGYSEEELSQVPDGANLGLGCGNPILYADIKPGEIVLDLGSGAGLDAFLAARRVGPLGKVIGVDMTPDMLAKARANAVSVDAKNVEFREGVIEDLPLKDCAVDLVISNCVINLSTDKPQVFKEIARVLKPGGRMLVSDLVLNRPLSDALKNNVEAYVGCVSGASLKEEYLRLAEEAGLTNVEIVNEIQYDVGLSEIGEELRNEALEAVASVKVRAYKQKDFDCCGGNCC